MSRTGTRAGAALAIVFGLAAGTARAEERPFALKGTATWDNVGNAFTEVGANFDGVALVTHLGKVGQGGIGHGSQSPGSTLCESSTRCPSGSRTYQSKWPQQTKSAVPCLKPR